MTSKNTPERSATNSAISARSAARETVCALRLSSPFPYGRMGLIRRTVTRNGTTTVQHPAHVHGQAKSAISSKLRTLKRTNESHAQEIPEYES
jgi:hypothetical protein